MSNFTFMVLLISRVDHYYTIFCWLRCRLTLVATSRWLMKRKWERQGRSVLGGTYMKIFRTTRRTISLKIYDALRRRYGAMVECTLTPVGQIAVLRISWTKPPYALIHEPARIGPCVLKTGSFSAEKENPSRSKWGVVLHVVAQIPQKCSHLRKDCSLAKQRQNICLPFDLDLKVETNAGRFFAWKIWRQFWYPFDLYIYIDTSSTGILLGLYEGVQLLRNHWDQPIRRKRARTVISWTPRNVAISWIFAFKTSTNETTVYIGLYIHISIKLIKLHTRKSTRLPFGKQQTSYLECVWRMMSQSRRQY